MKHDSPTANSLYWERARAALPGEFLSTEYVDSGSGSWRSDWSVKLSADGGWKLYAVYEPVDGYEGSKPVPELRGSFKTKEEAIAAVETESWGN